MPKKVRRSIGQRKKYDNWWMGKKPNPVIAGTVSMTEGKHQTKRSKQPSSVTEPHVLPNPECCRWFFTAETCTRNKSTELIDSDGHSAEEFFLVLDKVYPYDPSVVDVDELYVQQKFLTLRQTLMKSDIPGFDFVSSDPGILLIQLYTEDFVAVKLDVRITQEFKACVCVHRVELNFNHDLWHGLPKLFDDFSSVFKLLLCINRYTVCIGNPDEQFVDKIPEGLSGSREADMGAVGCGIRYHCTIRSTACEMLCEGVRCKKCSSYRATLRKAASRQKCLVPTSPGTVNLSSNKPYRTMTKQQLIDKCQGLRTANRSVERTSARMRSTIREQLNSVSPVDEATAKDLMTVMNSNNAEVIKAYPDPNSYERLFWNEQLKYAQLKDARAMKWHPMIIKWCLHLQSKSSAAYESLRESGFIKLPSSRTLYDYSHFLQSRTGFQPDVVEHLVKEMSLLSINEDWQRYAGILYDEIKIRSDLVYDKHSGELVGYVNLDKMGSDLMQLENVIGDQQIEKATHVLVLMVRGIATRLKYPFAHFATTGITADFIYFIIQEALEILEIDCGLKILFITCDGASANRKFFNLHQLPSGVNDSVVYCTENPYSVDDRYIYFISDVPHLLKTTRNCLANSGSHKMSRHLWNNGDISWMHIVNLFDDHCSGLYRVVPKLTKSHINLTSFSCMKVNLAAQVFSKTVATALETMYGESVSKTVELIQHMNRFFDCLNTKNLNEGQKKRNPDLLPYTHVDDERLQWLMNDFLSYFENWKRIVWSRNGQFTTAQRNAMLLSPQTCSGLEISVKSIVSCVKFLLQHNVPFVLTECFNQDPLEQHFGIHRQSCGANDNPTVTEFNHNITRIRVVGSQALAPVRGNTKRSALERVVDDSPLQKRKRNK